MYMKGYIAHIERDTLENDNFRRVLYTGPHMQLVLMSIAPGDDIGEEVHADTDQFIRCEEGVGSVVIDGVAHSIEDGGAVVVPSGARHNVINLSQSEPLQLYTLYAPPHHKNGVVHATKEEALADDEEHDGVTSEE